MVKMNMSIAELKEEMRAMSRETEKGSWPVPAEVQDEFLRCYGQGLPFPDWVKKAMPFVNWERERLDNEDE
jgi:hypothetical protein